MLSTQQVATYPCSLNKQESKGLCGIWRVPNIQPQVCGTAGLYCRIFIGIRKLATAAVPSTDSELAVRAPESVQALIWSRRTHSTGRAQGGEVSWLGRWKKRERDWRMGCTHCCLSNNPNNNITFPILAATKMTHQSRNREMCFFPLQSMEERRERGVDYT